MLGWYFPESWGIQRRLKWALYRYEHATVSYLRSSLGKGAVVVDIGAHIGYYARLCSRLVGPHGMVYAFEPYPENVRLLANNCRYCRNVRIVDKAVSGQSCLCRFYEHRTSTFSHSLTDISSSSRYIEVEGVSLDDWSKTTHLPRLDLVLIDVEGSEHTVLDGMAEVLEQYPDVTVVMEYCPDNYAAAGLTEDVFFQTIQKTDLHILEVLTAYGATTIPAGKTCAEQVEMVKNEFEVNRKKGNYLNLVLAKAAS